jgi:hypothetical protein
MISVGVTRFGITAGVALELDEGVRIVRTVLKETAKFARLLFLVATSHL